MGSLGTLPSVAMSPLGANATGNGSDGPVAARGPLSVPARSSLAGARASLYLDFDGFFEGQWGTYGDITTPAYDQDGDATTFSAAEAAAIDLIWQQVSEDYAPFAINVTTVLPSSFADGVAERVAIGGDGAWYSAGSGGASYVDSFTNSIPNTAYVFARNLGNGDARYTADAVSHESGHAFGLQHQSLYSGTTATAEYSRGSGDGRAPIMGDSYSATRGLWWDGPASASSESDQDDMTVLARPANGFGYRADDHGGTASTASPLAVSGAEATASGVIATTSDADDFSFATGTGTIVLRVGVAAGINNLDAILELRDASGLLIAWADPSTSFDATLTVTVPAGSYRLVVRSHGSYGDVGQYTVGATLVSPESPAAETTSLAASADSTPQVPPASVDDATGDRVGPGPEIGVPATLIGSTGASVASSQDASDASRSPFSSPTRRRRGDQRRGLVRLPRPGRHDGPRGPIRFDRDLRSPDRLSLSASGNPADPRRI